MIGILVLLVVLTIPAASAELSGYYLVPKDSVAAGGDTVDVEVWLNATVPVAGGFVGINYTHGCVDIISYSPNKTLFEDEAHYLADGRVTTVFSHWEDGWALTNQPIGLYHLGNLTIQCCGESCETDLLLIGCELSESVNYEESTLSFVTTNGTVTCTAGDQPQCLGTCCNDSGCTDPFAENVPCSGCIAAGKYWHPNKDAACFDDHTPFDLCLDFCPECCNATDDDSDGNVDYPADTNCTCGLDLDEETKNPVGPDPIVPELPTLALAGIGILGIALLARKRD